MRTPVIAGNWKMYNDLAGTRVLLTALLGEIKGGLKGVHVIVCPPFTSLSLASELLADSPVLLGAQNMSEHEEGAFTGEISARMLRGTGCTHVILGHSERRQYHGENDRLVNAKARKALASGLTPIICVGETLQQREELQTASVVGSQVRGVLEGLSDADVARCIIAYEPVWAIGTGRTATPEQAQEVHAMIRDLVVQSHGRPTAESLVIQYGGSVKPDNAADLMCQKDVDGALVGGACLKVESFMPIINAALK